MVPELDAAGTTEQGMVRIGSVHMRMQLSTPALLRLTQDGPLDALCCLREYYKARNACGTRKRTMHCAVLAMLTDHKADMRDKKIGAYGGRAGLGLGRHTPQTS